MTAHDLVIKIFDDGHVIVSVACPHTGTDRPCASWRENNADEVCICTCEACVDEAHLDCESDYVEDIGRKWCDARPVNECWYEEAVAQVGWQELLDFGHDGVQARIPVRLHGGSWEAPIEVEAVATADAETERLRTALRYIERPTMSLPASDADAEAHALVADERAVRLALQTCIRTARAALGGGHA